MLLIEKIELKLRHAILSGEYRAGERLIEKELKEKYRVSRTVIREALRNLNSSGLIHYIAQKGYTVKKFSIKDIKVLYDLIFLLEGYACEISVPTFSEKEINKLKELHEKMKLAASNKDYKTYRSLNFEFHALFVNETGEEILIEMVNNIRTKIYIYRYLGLMLPDAMPLLCEQHGSIIEGAVKKDAKNTKAKMQKHIKTAKDYLITAIENSALE